MIIATIQEANAIACGCCPHPVCSPPRLETSNRCCIPAPFATGEDFSAMGLPEDFLDRCFETIERRFYQVETIENYAPLEGGIPANFTSTIIDDRKAKFSVPLEPIAGSCALQRVERTRDFSRRERSDATGSPAYYYIINYDENTVGTTGDCAGTGTEYTESYLPSGTDPGTSTSTAATFCDDLSSLIIDPDWTYSSPSNGVHVFTKNTVTGDIETTGLLDLTLTITLTEWEGGGKELYKFCVPENYSTEEAPRSTWEMQWDIAFMTERWLEWYLSDRSDPEPSNYPILHSSHDWTWSGSMEDPCSPIEKMPSPAWHGHIDDEEAAIVWIAMRINIMVVCWKSTRTGVKPTAIGLQYAWPEPP
jgi:hypothetical protein